MQYDVYRGALGNQWPIKKKNIKFVYSLTVKSFHQSTVAIVLTKTGSAVAVVSTLQMSWEGAELSSKGQEM